MISTHWAFGMAFSWYIHVHVVGTKRNDKLNVWSQSQFRNNDGNDNIEQYSRYKKICSLTTAKRCRRAKFLTPICIISFLPRCLFIFVFPSSDGGPEIKRARPHFIIYFILLRTEGVSLGSAVPPLSMNNRHAGHVHAWTMNGLAFRSWI